MPVRVAVDAMGGDNAPATIVRGAVLALRDEEDIQLFLVGDQSVIHRELEAVSASDVAARIQVVHASEVVGMDEPPVEALRLKKDSSLVRMAELAADRRVDAILSAGNTGACAAVAQLKLRPLAGVTRPGIAVTIPSFHGPFVLCDVGANIQAKPRHLFEYAVMATAYAERVIGIERPRVALISIGEESNKGNSLVKQTHHLLSADSRLHFVGNAEGRELFENRCDVAICDGFVGNIILKFVEGLAAGLFATIGREFETEVPAERQKFTNVLERVWSRHDYSRYGGAPLLGIDGVCIICHGRSNETAIRNAVRVARRFVRERLNETIASRLA